MLNSDNLVLNVNGREVWDNNKLQAYACEMRGKLAMEEHLISIEPSEALVFGQGIHKMVEVWTKFRLAVETGKLSNEAAIAEAKKAFLTVWEAGLPLALRTKLEMEENRRSYTNACRLFEAFTRKFPLEMFDEIVATEQEFTVPLGTTPMGRVIDWDGILDRAVIWQGGLYYADVKTSSFALDDKFFRQFRLSGQMTGYAYAGEKLGLGQFTGIMVQAIEVKSPPKTARGRTIEQLIASDIIPINPAHIEEWRLDTLQKIDDIHRARERKHWIMNRGDLCTKWSGGCLFRPICEAEPSAREMRKEKYYKVSPWDPRTRRES